VSRHTTLIIADHHFVELSVPKAERATAIIVYWWSSRFISTDLGFVSCEFQAFLLFYLLFF